MMMATMAATRATTMKTTTTAATNRISRIIFICALLLVAVVEAFVVPPTPISIPSNTDASTRSTCPTTHSCDTRRKRCTIIHKTNVYDRYCTLMKQSSSSSGDDNTTLTAKTKPQKKNKKRNNNPNKNKKTQKKQYKGKYSNRANQNNKELIQAKAINKQLIESKSAQDVLQLFIAKGGAKGVAGGDAFNSVNYSTFMHRLARFASFVDYSKQKRNINGNGNGNGNFKSPASTTEDKRKAILSDPRTAILIASLSEALVQPDSNKTLVFNNRELANLGWAIAKLRLAPPSNIYPLVRLEEVKHVSKSKSKSYVSLNSNSNVRFVPSQKEMNDDILETAMKVRKEVLEVAKERNNGSNGSTVKNKWIPTMSQLSGKLLDVIAVQVLCIVDNFNSQELANLLYAFSSAGRGDVYFFEQLADQLVKNMSGGTAQYSQPKPQEYSNSIWAFASSGIRCGGQQRLMQCVAETLDRNRGEIVKDFKPQELSNTAWGVATLISRRVSEDSSSRDMSTEDQSSLRILRWVAKSLCERVDDFKPQEISNSIWAFATLGFGATSSPSQFNTNNEYISLPSDQPEADRKLVSETLLIVAKNASGRLHRFRPQELNNLAWGFCRLGHYSEEMKRLYEGVGQEIIKRHRFFAPQDIGTTLWSFATVEYYDEAVFKAAASELTLSKSRSFKPQELSNTVWALATAGAVPRFVNAFDSTTLKSSHRVSLNEIRSDPITACFAAATTELIRRPHEFKEQEIKDVLWSLSRAGIRHPVAFKKVAEHLVGTAEGGKTRGLNLFSPQGLGNLAWSYAKQAQLAGGGSESLVSTTGRLAVYETISLDVGEDLVRKLFFRIGETALHKYDNGLNRFKPQDLSNTCWAFATLGLLHRGYFRAVGDQVERRLGSFDPKVNPDNLLSKFKAQEIANLVWAFATLNYNSPGMMESFTPYITYISCEGGKRKNYDERSIARYFKRQEVSNIAWSCTVLEQYPLQLMPLLYTAMFGGNNSNPDSLKAMYGDDGIQRQSIMTMFYVQMALAMEAPELDLSLPPQFPSDWRETDSSDAQTLNVDAVTTLQITTSRLQERVSHALDRIGYEHVQEHIISTSELEINQGIFLSNENQEFLSIDIADVENMIGIEVDGPGHFITLIDDMDDSKMNQSYEGAFKTSGGKSGYKFMGAQKQQINGPTALKDRLLQNLGWSVLHIPYWDWRDLKGDKDAEERYLQNLLQSVK